MNYKNMPEFFEYEDLVAAAFNSAINEDNGLKKETYGYIHTIVYPIFEEMDEAEDIEKWKKNKNYPKKIFKIEYVNDYDYEYDPEGQEEDDDENLKRNLKYAICKNIAVSCRKVLKERMKKFDSSFITPWDVKMAIQKDYATMFKVDKSDKIELTLRVENKDFVHSLDEEFVYGLLLFSEKSGYEILPILDFPIFDDYFVEIKHEDTNKFEYTPNNKNTYYILEVDDRKYYFETASFIQGIITGQKWSKNNTIDFTKITQVTPEGTYHISY